MITDYENRHLGSRTGRGRVDENAAPVRVKRAWRGVVHGQILDKLPKVKRDRLLRAGFVELAPEVKKPVAKKKAAKKKTA